MPASKRSDASTIVTSQGSDWIHRPGNKFTKLISNTTCVRMCSLYVDEQVEYEIRQEDCSTTMNRMVSVVSSVGAAGVLAAPARAAAVAGLDVELYKQFLFDEESVLTSLTEREDEDDHHHGDDDDALALSRLPYRQSSLSSRGTSHIGTSTVGRPGHPDQTQGLATVVSHDEDHMAIVSQRSH